MHFAYMRLSDFAYPDLTVSTSLTGEKLGAYAALTRCSAQRVTEIDHGHTET